MAESVPTDSDYRITRVTVTDPNNAPAAADRTLTWMGQTLTNHIDNRFPSLTQKFGCTATNRLAS